MWHSYRGLGMAYVVMAYMPMAYMPMAYIVVVYICKAYIAMAYVVMAYKRARTYLPVTVAYRNSGLNILF